MDIESFTTGALVLRRHDLHLLELNATSHELLALFVRPVSAAEAAIKLSQVYEIPADEILDDLLDSIAWFAGKGIIVKYMREEEN